MSSSSDERTKPAVRLLKGSVEKIASGKLERLKESINAGCDRFFRKRGMTKAKWNW